MDKARLCSGDAGSGSRTGPAIFNCMVTSLSNAFPAIRRVNIRGWTYRLSEVWTAVSRRLAITAPRESIPRLFDLILRLLENKTELKATTFPRLKHRFASQFPPKTAWWWKTDSAHQSPSSSHWWRCSPTPKQRLWSPPSGRTSPGWICRGRVAEATAATWGFPTPRPLSVHAASSRLSLHRPPPTTSSTPPVRRRCALSPAPLWRWGKGWARTACTSTSSSPPGPARRPLCRSSCGSTEERSFIRGRAASRPPSWWRIRTSSSSWFSSDWASSASSAPPRPLCPETWGCGIKTWPWGGSATTSGLSVATRIAWPSPANRRAASAWRCTRSAPTPRACSGERSCRAGDPARLWPWTRRLAPSSSTCPRRPAVARLTTRFSLDTPPPAIRTSSAAWAPSPRRSCCEPAWRHFRRLLSSSGGCLWWTATSSRWTRETCLGMRSTFSHRVWLSFVRLHLLFLRPVRLLSASSFCCCRRRFLLFVVWFLFFAEEVGTFSCLFYPFDDSGNW